MKNLIFGLLLLGFSQLAAAEGVSGKYQLELETVLSGIQGTFEFLVNSQGESKLLNKSDGYWIQNFYSASFFGNLEVEVEWGSDEESHFYIFTVEDIKGAMALTKSCSLFVDGPNGYHEFEGLRMSLKKWNKFNAVYEEVPVVQSQKTFENCQKELAKKYL